MASYFEIVLTIRLVDEWPLIKKPDGRQKNAENIEHALRWLFEGKRG